MQLNEIHYDDSFNDDGEFVEFVFLLDSIVSPSNIGGLVLYEEATSASREVLVTQEAVLYFDPEDPNVGFAVWETPLNDGPFALALVDGCNSVVQFVSLEGRVTATEGVAKGMASTDIRYSEDGTATGDESLQRQSCQAGNQFPTWVSASRTPGASNVDQDVRSCLEQGSSPVAPSTPLPIALPTAVPVSQPTQSPVTAGPTDTPVSLNLSPPLTAPSQAPLPAPSQAPLMPSPRAIEPIEVAAGSSVTIPVPPGVDQPEVVAVPVHGTLVFENDGTIVFEPDSGFQGTDSFDLKYCEQEGSCSVVNYTVNVAFPSKKSPAAVAGTVVAFMVVIGVIGAAAYIYMRKRQVQTPKPTQSPENTDSSSSSPDNAPAHVAVASDPSSAVPAISDNADTQMGGSSAAQASLLVDGEANTVDVVSATPPMAQVLPAHDAKPHPEYKEQVNASHPPIAVALADDPAASSAQL